MMELAIVIASIEVKVEPIKEIDKDSIGYLIAAFAI